MPQATMLVLDNSSSSINGDYEPTRWLNQIDAAGLLIQTRLEQHHENAVGIALSAGKQVQIICPPCTDLTKVSSFLYGVKQFGGIKLSVVLQTSALALKHRLNSDLSQRIICFVASSISDSIEELKLVGKKLKKNGVALDLIALGDLSETQKQILQTLHQNAKSERDSSELLYIQPMSNISDMLYTTNILGQAQQPIINEVEDPELMMALQLSLQQAEQRLAASVAPVAEQDLENRALELAMDEQKEQDEKEGQKKQ